MKTIKYLLDTDICIYLTTGRHPHLKESFAKHIFEESAISSITVFELLYGVAKSLHYQRNQSAMREFLFCFEILEFEETAAQKAGELRALLESRGKIIGPYDFLLAGQALSADLVLVTNNVREFARVPGLKLENWVNDAG